ncbi:hypothetical protein ABK040_016705 [Willaertia magna]
MVKGEVQQTKFLKPGKIVIVLQGKYAGKKAVIVKNNDEGTTDKPYPHAVLVGINRAPKPVTKKMPIEKIQKRSKITTFIKSVNYAHLMPTRHTLDLDFKGVLDKVPEDATQKKEAKVQIKKKFEARYLKGGKALKEFFYPLQF